MHLSQANMTLLSIPDTIGMPIVFSIIPSPPPMRAHKEFSSHWAVYKHDICAWAFPYIVLSPYHKRPFFKMAAQKACVHDILLAFEWIPFKFLYVVLWVFMLIWLTFGENSLKTRRLTEDICPPKKLVGAISYEPLVGSHLNLMLFAGYFGWSELFLGRNY